MAFFRLILFLLTLFLHLSATFGAWVSWAGCTPDRLGQRVIMKRTALVTGFCLATGLISISPLTASEQTNAPSRNFSVIIELAGADESDRATQKELKESGTKMVPASPSAESRDPLKEKATPAEEKPKAIVVEEKKPQPVPAENAPTEPEPKSATDATKADTPAAAAKAEPPAEPEPTKVTKTAEDADLLFKPYARLITGYAIPGSPGGEGRNGTHQSISVQDTGILGAGIGMKVDDQVRLEGNLTYYSPFDVDGRDGAGNTISTEVESISGMLSVLYDIEQIHEYVGSDTFTPYIGGGVGITMLDTDSLSTTGAAAEPGTEVYNLTYALRAGLSAKFSERLTLDFGYKFINLGQFEQDGGVSNGVSAATTKFDDLLVHELTAGLRFQF